MINNKPNNKKYHQGLFIPKNPDKLIQKNSEGGVYYRSGLEQKMMIYLDNNDSILHWGSENFKVPYTLKKYDTILLEYKETQHCYYPDFYYEQLQNNGSITKVVAEVKPYSNVIEPKLSANPTSKQVKNFEYELNMYNKNLNKWTYMIDFCKKKGFEFIIITEKLLG